MFVVNYQHGWGSRGPRHYTSLYFTRKPERREIINCFKKQGIFLQESSFAPHMSGLITIRKIKTEF